MGPLHGPTAILPSLPTAAARLLPSPVSMDHPCPGPPSAPALPELDSRPAVHPTSPFASGVMIQVRDLRDHVTRRCVDPACVVAGRGCLHQWPGCHAVHWPCPPDLLLSPGRPRITPMSCRHIDLQVPILGYGSLPDPPPLPAGLVLEASMQLPLPLQLPLLPPDMATCSPMHAPAAAAATTIGPPNTAPDLRVSFHRESSGDLLAAAMAAAPPSMAASSRQRAVWGAQPQPLSPAGSGISRQMHSGSHERFNSSNSAAGRRDVDGSGGACQRLSSVSTAACLAPPPSPMYAAARAPGGTPVSRFCVDSLKLVGSSDVAAAAAAVLQRQQMRAAGRLPRRVGAGVAGFSWHGLQLAPLKVPGADAGTRDRKSVV